MVRRGNPCRWSMLAEAHRFEHAILPRARGAVAPNNGMELEYTNELSASQEALAVTGRWGLAAALAAIGWWVFGDRAASVIASRRFVPAKQSHTLNTMSVTSIRGLTAGASPEWDGFAKCARRDGSRHFPGVTWFC